MCQEGKGAPLARERFGSGAQPIAGVERGDTRTSVELFGLQRMPGDGTGREERCVSYGELYDGLREMQANTFEHVHLENNILFPRALELERTIRQERTSGF